MNFKRPAFFAVATIALALAGGAAFAHEGAHRNPNAPVKKEQKPWGIAGDAKAVTRTVGIAMADTMRFTPSRVEVMQGETVRFVISNKGRLLHEMVIGDKQTLDEHAALMARFPKMEHDEPFMAHVPAGKQGALVWNFNRPGEFDFACLVAGHYQAGMIGKITVAATATAVPQAGHVQGRQAAPAATQNAISAATFTDGEVRKVDKDAKKITLQHGAIKNLAMPAMTMVFAVKDAAILNQVKPGDKVRFKAIDDGGKLTVVEIEAAK